jgi:hypothetical protein
MLEHESPTLDPTKFAKTSPESLEERWTAAQEANAVESSCGLCLNRTRRGDETAHKASEERPAIHQLMISSARSSSDGGMVSLGPVD